MKMSKEREQWLAIAEKYFDAATTDQEEKALAEFLATDESNTPEFNEIKAVMGYVATARKAENAQCGPQKPESRSRIRRWIATASVAATIAITAGAGLIHNTWGTEEKDVYIADINGRICTDKEFVLDHMQQTIAMIGNTTRGNDIEEQLGAMFSLTIE